MGLDASKVGPYIQKLRKKKNITQNQLGERLNISYQAVSKWERGEALPDASILVDLADILETSVDNILNGGERLVDFNKKISAKDIKTGIDYLSDIGNLIGKDNTVYAGMVEGINNKMNIDVEECFNNPRLKEALISEIIIQELKKGAYVDLTDALNCLKYDHCRDIIKQYTKKYGIK